MLNYLLFVMLAIPTLASAAPPAVTLQSVILTEKTATVDGRSGIVLQKPKSLLPGDRLVFETSYRNHAAQPATKVVLNNPIPKGIAFSGDSSAGAEVSVDGGKSFGAITALKVKDAAGQLRPAQPDDVTNIRWTIPSIAPGTSGVVKYRGIVR